MSAGGGGTQPIPISSKEAVSTGNVIDPSRGSQPGTFAYQFTFSIPPGRSGMTPDLMLSYSSNDHSDTGFGYGWGLSIPYIQRYNKTGLDDLYSTTTLSTFFYSSVSGELTATSTSAMFVARNDDGSNMQYSFGNNAWTAVDKAGTIYRFGLAPQSRQDDTTSTKIFRWYLQKQIDTNGNSITYTYSKDLGQIYPSSITYSANNTSTSTPPFAINFTLGLLATSTATSSAAGFPVKTRYQVNQIDIQINGSTTKSYTLGYGAGDNSVRTLLKNITEIGKNASTTLALPPTTFNYSTSTSAMATSTWSNPAGNFVENGTDRGISMADVNGDGLADLVQSYENLGYSVSRGVYLNTGSGWSTSYSPTFNPPCNFIVEPHYTDDGGGRLVDVNGDGLPDFICTNSVFINTGTNWMASSTWDTPVSMNYLDSALGKYTDMGVRFGDINGDGLVDLVYSDRKFVPSNSSFLYTQQVYLNTGSGWARNYSWNIPIDPNGLPVIFTNDTGRAGGGVLADINGDGLADILQGMDGNYGVQNQAYINNGHGWTNDPTWILPGSLQAQQPGMIISDLNGDGLPDVSSAVGYLPYTNNPASFSWTTNFSYLNTGSGWKYDPSRFIPLPYFISNPDSYGDVGPRTGNISGNGLSDLMVSSFISIYNYGGIQFALGDAADLLNHVTESGGKQITPTYQSTSKFRDSNNNLLNPKLASFFPAVQKIQTYDGVAATSTESYQYKDGTLYFGSSTDRRSGGFGSITKTDAVGNKSTSYFHTGNGSATSTGEYLDTQSKIGKVYRVENYNSATTLFKVLITKWDNVIRGLANFIWPIRTTSYDYDGGSTPKVVAEESSYSTTTGDLLQKISWGEVSALGDDGSFTDIGTDERITNLSYAASTTLPFSKVSEKITLDQNNALLGDTRYLYDGLGLGSIAKGNMTEQDDLKTASSTFIQSIRKVYNSFGLVTQEINPRSATTTYVYDTYNLYPAKVTNSFSQSTAFLYNYYNGQPTRTTDPNGFVKKNTYDLLNRLIGVLKPDPIATSTLSTSTEFIYTDTGMPRLTHQIDYLNATSSVHTYLYKDGYGREVESRAQAEGTSTYAVKDSYYNGVGLLSSQSLPYFGSGTSYTGVTLPPSTSLLTTYAYDPLQRPLRITNSVGSTINSYSPWHVTTIDPNNNVKDAYKDAYGNLSSIIEHPGSLSGTTQYVYNGNNYLTKIIDAAGNVRNFNYDLLGRRLRAEDLHPTADSSYGAWNSVYDDTGNLTQQTDPKNQVINYTYDLLNRPLTEDYSGLTGIETTYVYDSCAFGIGHLCSATVATSTATTSYAYDISGNTVQEKEAIGGVNYSTFRAFDRLGNTTSITYPDNSQVLYTYNNAGLLESISQKPSGANTYTGIVTNFNYSPTSQIAYKQFGNGVTTTNTYDAAHLYRLSRIQTVSSSGFGTLMVTPAMSATTTESRSPATTQTATSSLLSFKDINKKIILAFNDDPTYQPTFYPAASADSTTPATQPDVPKVDASTSMQSSKDKKDVPDVSASTTDGSIASTTTATTSSAEQSLPKIIPTLNLPDASTILLATTTQSGFTASTTQKFQRTFADELKMLPDNSPELALKAPRVSILGEILLKEGLIKYAYRTNISVDNLPASDGTLKEARKDGVILGSEVVGKRTATTRTFATNNPQVFVAEINSGEPSYYKDTDGSWWLASYAVTTPTAFDAQMKPAPKSFIDALISFFVPQRALATGATFYPGAGEGAYGADGNMYLDNFTDWFSEWDYPASNNYDYLSTHEGVNAKYGTGYGPDFYGITRALIGFNATSLDSRAVISSASINLYITIHTQSGSENRVFITTAAPYHDDRVYLNDYATLGNIAVGSSSGTYITNAYNQINLTPAGIAQITNAGISHFGVKTYNDMYNIAPTASTTYDTNWASAESGVSTAPQLVITYSLAPGTPNTLLTEGQANPTTLGNHTPSFSALFSDADVGDYATNYQLQISTSSTIWTNPFWDSSQHAITASTTNGARSPDIIYGGSPMSASTPYYWRIRFWDSFNSPSVWSTETASFSIAPWYNPSAPTNLLVNGTTSPMSLSSTTPTFTATYNNTIATDTASSYEIQVTNSGAGWIAPTWDSLKQTLASSTPSGIQIQPVTYSGQTLISGSAYDWRIRFWNSEDSVGAWSTTTATFGIASGLATADLQDIFYTYDNNGNILQINDLSGTTAGKVERFTYDSLNRLLNASTTAASTLPFSQSYTYDLLGNFTNKSDVGNYTYAGTGYANPHAPTTIGATALTYDNNGNLTNYGTTTYQWDYKNRMTGSVTGSTTTTNFYDYLSQRIKTVIGGVTTSNPNNLYNISGTTTTDHIYDTQGNPVATYQLSSSTQTYTYLHADNLGSTNVTSNSLGHLNETTDYYPYGALRIDTGSPLEQRKYIGQQYDGSTGLNYLNARYQDPARGQFLSEDPTFLAIGDPQKLKSLAGIDQATVLSDPQSLNSYSYARDNPITKSDPTGLWYGELLSGQQSFSSFGNEINSAATYLPQVNSTWGTALSHPIVAGMGVGVLSVPVAEAGMSSVAAVTTTNLSAGTSFLAGRALQTAGYSYLTYEALRNIPNTIDIVSSGLKSKDPYVRAKAAVTAAYNTIPALAGEKVGGMTDVVSLFTAEVNLIKNVANRTQTSNSKDFKKTNSK
ncbi:MAG: SpvB/TcaC N-terminal domain-containing protein [Candidatus Paceibacterota bacterium]